MLLETTLLWLCLQGKCIQATPEAVAVAMCESGDTATLGTGDWRAINVNTDGTVDAGAWQFNSYYVWNPDNLWAIEPVAQSLHMTGAEFMRRYPTPDVAPPYIQYYVFLHLWDNGAGAWHWSASKHCWGEVVR
jgi:hypothetical protein